GSGYFGYPGYGGCAPYYPLQYNVPGRDCGTGPCGGVEPPVPPYGGGGGGGYGPDCCPLTWWGCKCCQPCQPAVFVYVGPRVSYLKVDSGVLFNTITDTTVTESIIEDRSHATMFGFQTGIWYRAAGKVFEQIEGYWEKGNA